MEKNNNLVMQGTLRTNKTGVKTMPVWGSVVTIGYNVLVNDEEGRFVTSMQLKTDDPEIAKKLADSVGESVAIEGYLRSENTISKAAKEADPSASRWITYVYVKDVCSFEQVSVSNEPTDF